MVKVRVRFFSIYSDVASDLELEVGDNLSVGELVEIVKSKYQELESLFERVEPTVLVNGSRASASCALRDGDEVAFIPPASGG